MSTTNYEEHKVSSLDHLDAKGTITSDEQLGNTATSLADVTNDKSDVHERVFKAEDFYVFKNLQFTKVPILLNIDSDSMQVGSDMDRTYFIEDIIGASLKQSKLSLKKLKLDEEQFSWAKGLYVLKVHLLVKPKKEEQEKKEEIEKGKGKDEDEEKVKNIQPTARKYEKFRIYSHNYHALTKWRNLIIQAANNPDFKKLYGDLTINDIPDFSRLLMVFISGHSGQGKASDHWKKCKKLLDKAGCISEEHFIYGNSDCVEYLNSLSADELKKYGAIIAVSGDGLPCKIINTFYSRPDKDDLVNVPIMLIPAGSCNALTKNVMDKSNELETFEGCVFLLAKGQTIKADLTVLEKQDGTKIYSPLSLSWGAPSNIDLESKIMRPLGHARFYIYAWWEVLNLNKYKGKFSYSLTQQRPPLWDKEIQGEDWKTIEDDFCYFYTHNMAWQGFTEEMSPLSDLNDGVNYFMALKGENISRGNLINVRHLLRPNNHIKDEKEFEKLGLTVGKMRAFRLEPSPEASSKTIYSIDGEQEEAVPIQGYIIENGLTLIGLNRKSKPE